MDAYSYLRTTEEQSGSSILKRLSHFIALIKFYHERGLLKVCTTLNPYIQLMPLDQASPFRELQSILSLQRNRFKAISHNETRVKTDPDLLLSKGMLTPNGMADFVDVMDQVKICIAILINNSTNLFVDSTRFLCLDQGNDYE
jgi:hypothetical protein